MLALVPFPAAISSTLSLSPTSCRRTVTEDGALGPVAKLADLKTVVATAETHVSNAWWTLMCPLPDAGSQRRRASALRAAVMGRKRKIVDRRPRKIVDRRPRKIVDRRPRKIVDRRRNPGLRAAALLGRWYGRLAGGPSHRVTLP